jgi:pimeloyl-ACP methyl ester carboxylesterase
VDGVVLETTARNPKEVADSWKPWYLGPLVRIRIKDSLAAYDNALALKSFPGPILVLGAEKDRTLEVELARSLNQALVAGGRKVTYVEIPGGGHSTLPGSPEFMPALEVFFDAVATAP